MIGLGEVGESSVLAPHWPVVRSNFFIRPSLFLGRANYFVDPAGVRRAGGGRVEGGKRVTKCSGVTQEGVFIRLPVDVVLPCGRAAHARVVHVCAHTSVFYFCFLSLVTSASVAHRSDWVGVVAVGRAP